MTIHDSFYSNKFKELTAFYRQEDAMGQAAFLFDVVPLRPGDWVLDLACGFGRHSIELARRGCVVTGYDQSTDYIERAKSDAEGAGVDVAFQRLDMRELDEAAQYDAVLSMSTSLAFYSDDVNEDIVRRIHRALKPEGTFVFDQGNVFPFVSAIMSGDLTRTEKLPDGWIHRRTFAFNAEDCVISSRSVIEDGQRSEETGWDLRYYTLPEVKALAGTTGFGFDTAYGDYDGSSYCADSTRMIVLMRRL